MDSGSTRHRPYSSTARRLTVQSQSLKFAPHWTPLYETPDNLCPNTSRRLRLQHRSKERQATRNWPLSAGFSFCGCGPGTGERFLKKHTYCFHAGAGLLITLVLATSGCNSQPGGDVMATVDGRKIFRTD